MIENILVINCKQCERVHCYSDKYEEERHAFGVVIFIGHLLLCVYHETTYHTHFALDWDGSFMHVCHMPSKRSPRARARARGTSH